MKFNYTIVIFLIIILFLLMYYTEIYETFRVNFGNTRREFAECNTITDCVTCAETFGCVYCKGTNRCVRDISKNALCPREDTAASEEGCGEDNSTKTTEYRQRTYGDCSGASDCKECLSSPGCYWCDTKKKCISSIGVYDTCKDDPVIKNSFSECDATSGRVYNPYEYPNPRTSTTALTSTSTITPRTTSNVPRTSSSTSLADTMSSIIPIVALSKDNNGNLSVSSLQTIIDSMKRDGYTFNTNAGKQNALQVIQNQRDQLRQNYKNTMKDYLLNSLEYVSDGTSLNHAKDIDNKIKELDDLSGYIQTMKIEGFVEGFLDNNLSKEITVNANLLEETAYTKYMMQILWLVNIVALGTFLYIR